MISTIARWVTAPSSGDDWGGSGWRARLLLHAFAFVGTAVVLGAVSWAANGDPLYVVLIAVVGLGHLVSATLSRRPLRLGFVIYPAALLAAWTMRAGLLTVFTGGSLFQLAKLLAVIQAMVSFNLRNLRSLYDSFLLSLAVVLLVSEAALSPSFAVFLAVFLVAFTVVALVFLVAAHPAGEAAKIHSMGSTRMLALGLAVPGIVLLTLLAAVGIFLVVPQAYRIRDAAPLPSRLDLTIGRPVAPVEVPRGDTAPSSGFLPSREGGVTRCLSQKACLGLRWGREAQPATRSGSRAMAPASPWNLPTTLAWDMSGTRRVTW